VMQEPDISMFIVDMGPHFIMLAVGFFLGLAVGRRK